MRGRCSIELQAQLELFRVKFEQLLNDPELSSIVPRYSFLQENLHGDVWKIAASVGTRTRTMTLEGSDPTLGPQKPTRRTYCML